ncbi:BAI1-associated protein 3 [Caerostris extrusa]|uniref:BAI1-associated protein 3 n=1 Tax=Caerostris extrusa TaxID=172846 RepID=A0AAV4W2F1_CAEEX|nr:BAI1-associated protein 3 [Caerostris extrusa]
MLPRLLPSSPSDVTRLLKCDVIFFFNLPITPPVIVLLSEDLYLLPPVSDIEDIRTDRLHLDIWDHDDESSVFDAARKLNEVSKSEGFRKIFQANSSISRTSTGENIDDFLGCKYSFRGHTIFRFRSLVLLGGEDRALQRSRSDSSEDLPEHQGGQGWQYGRTTTGKRSLNTRSCSGVFIQHELKQHFGPSYEWAGDLPQPALTILHQHAIQGDITELQQTLCRWIMYSKQLMEVPLDYALLYQLLDDISRSWGTRRIPLQGRGGSSSRVFQHFS